jgi:hypothetical protein
LPNAKLIIYALPDTHPGAVGQSLAALARLRIGTWSRCPTGEFEPNSRIGFLAASYEMGSSAQKERAEDLMRQLKGAGCDINEYDQTGHTPLLVAVLHGDPDLAEVLPRLGASASQPLQPRPGSARSSDLSEVNAVQYAMALHQKSSTKSERRAAVMRVLSEHSP